MNDFQKIPANKEMTLPQAILNSTADKYASTELEISPRSISVRPEGRTIIPKILGDEVKLTWWSFRQLCELAGVPLKYIWKLEPAMIAININYMLRRVRSKPIKALLVQRRDEGVPTLRALNGTSYTRVWDADLLSKTAIANGYMGKFEPFKVLKTDSTTQVVLTSEETQKVGDEVLRRGLKIVNSEVGAASVHISLFWFRAMCQNGLIFGWRGLTDFSVRHVGKILPKVDKACEEVLKNVHNDTELQVIQRAQRLGLAEIATSDDRIIKHLIQKARLEEGEARRALALARAEEAEVESPWSLAQGITALARGSDTLNQIRLEKAAGRYLERMAG